jgi:hypothetical protein
VKESARSIGVAKLAPHDLRRTCARLCHASGSELEQIGTTSEFLCTSDCVAEGAGFEPSVRFCYAKPRHIRKLQIAKPYQRISHLTPTSELCNQCGFDSPSIRT